MLTHNCMLTEKVSYQVGCKDQFYVPILPDFQRNPSLVCFYFLCLSLLPRIHWFLMDFNTFQTKTKLMNESHLQPNLMQSST